jgi:DNA-binding XRE family transcriptional regulator
MSDEPNPGALDEVDGIELTDEVLRKLRAVMGLNMKDFAELIGMSERSVFNLEKTGRISRNLRRVLTETAKMYAQVKRYFLDKVQFEVWLHRPNRAFSMRAPIDLIKAGESNLVWNLIHLFESQVQG